MPAMPRINNKATKIAYKIMGVPPSFAYKPTKEQKRINKKIIYTETRLSR